MATPNVIRYGFFHDKDAANAALGVSDCVENTFFVKFDGDISSENVLIDVEFGGHKYSAVGAGFQAPISLMYWRLGTTKNNTQFDFVDEKAAKDASITWPKVTATDEDATITVSTFDGTYETYPTNATVVNGADELPFVDASFTIGTNADEDHTILPPVVVEPEPTPEPEPDTDRNLAACPFDANTAKAVHGKKLLVLVTDRTGRDLLLYSGQQDTTWTTESETTEAATKDGDGEWVTKSAGQKSWSSSVNGLWPIDDEAQDMTVKALKEGELLCVGLYRREKDTERGTYIYSPVRKGLAYVTSNEISAPSDDNVTYSMNFDGTGELWMCEAATAKDIDDMTVEFPI